MTAHLVATRTCTQLVNLTAADFPKLFTMPTLKLPTWVQRYGSAHRMVADTHRQLRGSYGRHGRTVLARFMDAPLGSDVSVETLTGGRSVLLDALATETDPATRAVLMAALDALNAARPSTHTGATGVGLEISAPTAGPAGVPLPAETPPMVGCAYVRRQLASPTDPDAHRTCTPGVTSRVHARCGGTHT